MNNIAHNFQSMQINQNINDEVIGGYLIPAGYVNATQMCQVGKKKLNDWTRLKRSQAYIEALKSKTAIPVSLLMIEIETDYESRGTWVHPKVAISIAGWISPEFEVWASDVLLRVINGEFNPLTEEAQAAKAELTRLWQEVRTTGITKRVRMTDAIKMWLETNEVTDNYRHWIYSNCTELVNLAVFGKKSAQMCKERGCTSKKLRDTHTSDELDRLSEIENHARKLMERGMEPMMATKDAIDFYS